MKKYKVSLISLLFALVICICALSFTFFASADSTTKALYTLNGTNIFYTEVDGAELSVARETTGEGDNASTKDYPLFKIADGAEVTYKSDVAYSWYVKGENGEGVNQKFNMTIGFKNADFEKYTVKFQSQQYAKTKDSVTTNYLIFTPNGDKTGVYLTVSDDEDAEVDTTNFYATDTKLEIKFGEFKTGNYDIIVNNATILNVNGEKAQFVNVKETYSDYVSSGTSACMPLTFAATYAEGSEEGATAQMVIYQMNGQSFELVNVTEADDGTLSGGQVEDTCAPVVCIDGNVNYLNFGESIDLDYVVIDVLAPNASSNTTLNYYILSKTNYQKEDFNYENTEADDDGNKLFTEVSSSSTLRLLRDADTFVPSFLVDGDENNTTDGYEVFGLAKIYLGVSDVSNTSTACTDQIFLDWYVADEYKVNIYQDKLKNQEGTCDFIKIVTDDKGVTYAQGATTLQEYKDVISAITESYQAKIDAAIEKLEDGKIYAGSSNYFYLPEFSGYASDNFGGYETFTYSIYYKASSKSSNTSLNYNQLAINVTEADVTYKFTIYITDAEGNPMVYPSVDLNGDLVWEEITTSNIWDDDYADLLPFFTFDVSYKTATVEDPGTQTVAYVGSTYSSVSFDINGISNTYSTTYSLYTFDIDAFATDTGKTFTYEEFVKNVEALFENKYDETISTRKYFTTIKASADLKESDDDYDDLIDYAWNKSSVSFVPQDTSEYYVVQLVLTDTLSEQQTTKYMAIRASETPDSIEGEIDWVSNNVTSIVLLCIAGAAFIALIVLLLVKPKDKGDIDTIDMDNANGSKKGKKGKKAAAAK